MKTAKITAFLLILSFYVLPTTGFCANYGVIENKVLATPIEAEKDIKTLADYLSTDLNSVEEKARAIALWIAYFVDFDDYKQKLTENARDGESPENLTKSNVLLTRKGTSADFAGLFKEIGTAAGLKVAVIKGNYKGYRGSSPAKGNSGASKYQDYRSNWYWNAVSDGENWHLLDTSVAALGLNIDDSFSSAKAYNRDIAKRETSDDVFLRKIHTNAKRNKTLRDDDLWFFTKPADMIKTHYPTNPEWQLLTVPVPESAFFNM